MELLFWGWNASISYPRFGFSYHTSMILVPRSEWKIPPSTIKEMEEMKGNLPCSPLTSFLIPPITPKQNKHHRLGYRSVMNTAHTMCFHPRHSPSAPVVCLFFKSLCQGSTKVKVLENSTLYGAQPPSIDRNNRFCSSSPFWLNQTINTWFTAGVINVNMQNIQTESLAYTGIVSLPSFLKSEG